MYMYLFESLFSVFFRHIHRSGTAGPSCTPLGCMSPTLQTSGLVVGEVRRARIPRKGLRRRTEVGKGMSQKRLEEWTCHELRSKRRGKEWEGSIGGGRG